MYPTTLDTQTRVETPLKYEVVTQPAVEPVSYADLADWCKLPGFDDRTLTLQLAVAMRRKVEELRRETLITTTFDLWMDFFPVSIILPARPVQSVTFIKYTDGNGTVQTLDPSRFEVDPKGSRPVIIPPLGSFFPIAKVQYPNAVQVRFVAGYGDTAAAVPAEYQIMIKQLVALNYSVREGVVLGRTPAIVPRTLDYLLNSGRLWEV
jgi:uncharacterized phiE125 gp8 family phage protein